MLLVLDLCQYRIGLLIITFQNITFILFFFFFLRKIYLVDVKVQSVLNLTLLTQMMATSAQSVPAQ